MLVENLTRRNLFSEMYGGYDRRLSRILKLTPKGDQSGRDSRIF